MNRAIALPQYSDTKPFTAPAGVTTIRVDKETNLPADDSCPNDFSAAFLDGTIPQTTCSRMGDTPRNFLQKLFGLGGHNDSQPPQTPPATSQQKTDGNSTPVGLPPQQPPKKNFFKRLFGGGDKKQNPHSNDPDQHP
jgi:penicillin-binding protein 1B